MTAEVSGFPEIPNISEIDRSWKDWQRLEHVVHENKGTHVVSSAGPMDEGYIRPTYSTPLMGRTEEQVKAAHQRSLEALAGHKLTQETL